MTAIYQALAIENRSGESVKSFEMVAFHLLHSLSFFNPMKRVVETLYKLCAKPLGHTLLVRNRVGGRVDFIKTPPDGPNRQILVLNAFFAVGSSARIYFVMYWIKAPALRP